MPTLEDKVREQIDMASEKAGWNVQDYKQIYLSAGHDQTSVIGTKRQALTVSLPPLEGRIIAQRYALDFAVPGSGGVVTVRSLWIVRHGEDFPRFASCYVL